MKWQHFTEMKIIFYHCIEFYRTKTKTKKKTKKH